MSGIVFLAVRQIALPSVEGCATAHTGRCVEEEVVLKSTPYLASHEAPLDQRSLACRRCGLFLYLRGFFGPTHFGCLLGTTAVSPPRLVAANAYGEVGVH